MMVAAAVVGKKKYGISVLGRFLKSNIRRMSADTKTPQTLEERHFEPLFSKICQPAAFFRSHQVTAVHR